jgi:hypothetical protein
MSQQHNKMQFPAFHLTLCYTMQTWFKDFDYNMQVNIKEKFRQFVFPETTFMHPPPRKVNTKDAQKKHKHNVWSTKLSSSL